MAGKGAYVPTGIKTPVDQDAARRAAYAEPETLGMNALVCDHCGTVFDHPGGDTRRRYCSTVCIKRAYNERTGHHHGTRPIAAPDADWMDDGACHEQPHLTHLFFAVPPSWRGVGPGTRAATVDRYRRDLADAKNICTGCPVRQACLDYAVANRIEFGVWGGLDEDERRRVTRRRQRVVS